MSLFQTILLAADFSECSREAFRAVCSLSPDDKTRVIVLNVVGPRSAPQAPISIDESTTPNAVGSGGRMDHEEVRERLRVAYAQDRSRAVEFRVCDGDPAEEILAVARMTGCDVIALGAPSRTGLNRFLAGSVAETVMRHAHCPVLTLCSPTFPDPKPGAQTGVRTILHPTDFTECSSVALPVARTLARDHGARLILLHSISVVDVPHLSEPAPLEDPDACRKSLEELRERLEGPDLKYRVETKLRFGNPSAMIVRTAMGFDCGLIILGTHGRSGLGRLLLGSVAEEVLRCSPCPVLIVRAPVLAAAPMMSSVGSASM